MAQRERDWLGWFVGRSGEFRIVEHVHLDKATAVADAEDMAVVWQPDRVTGVVEVKPPPAALTAMARARRRAKAKGD